jgi:hypothetical protein
VHFGLKRFAPYSPDRLFADVVDQFIGGLRSPAKRRGKPPHSKRP